MRCSRRELASLSCLFFAHQRVRAQEEATFSADVKVVNLFATVRTKKGEIVRNLEKSDFTLLEDGHPQTIRYFSKESDLPLTLGLMVDTSMSQRKVLDLERSASFRFLDQVLRENKDQVFLVQFDMAVMMKQEPTSSRRKLEESLSLVDTPSRQDLSYQTGGGTLLYDAVVQASKRVMAGNQGRKAVILLTDGVDTGSTATLSDAINAALREDTLVYSILFSDETYYGGGIPLMGRLAQPDGRGVLMRLAKETGGSFFEVTKKQSLDQIFSQIEQELRSQYSLGFISDHPVRNSEFRNLQLTTAAKGLIVRTRDRYWARR